MSKPRLRPLQDRGAVLVHVGIALLVLMAFSALVLDYGILWVSRGQAQAAADAGALAGAVSLAYDSVDKSPTGPAVTKAVAAANENRVWGLPAGVTPADVSFPTCPDGTDTCIRVNVYRNVAHNNALPVFFARLFGRSEQGVQAMAIAQAAFGECAKCLKPWSIPDKWTEVTSPPWTWDSSTFDMYDSKGVLLANHDVYWGTEFNPFPTTDPSYTGYKAPPYWPEPTDYGQKVRLKMGSPHDAPAPGWFQPIDLPLPGGPETGGDRYRENISSCNPGVYSVSDPTPLVIEPGNMIGPTAQGVEALIASDPDEHWNEATKSIDCTGTNPDCSGERRVSIPLYDPQLYEEARQSGRHEIHIARVLGFFVDHMEGNDVIGYFTGAPAATTCTAPSGGPTSWLRFIRLVR